jgi:hypothetical protein
LQELADLQAYIASGQESDATKLGLMQALVEQLEQQILRLTGEPMG